MKGAMPLLLQTVMFNGFKHCSMKRKISKRFPKCYTASYKSVANGCCGASKRTYQPAGVCAYVRLGDCNIHRRARIVRISSATLCWVGILVSILSFLFCSVYVLDSFIVFVASKEWSGAGGYSLIHVGAAIQFAATIVVGQKKRPEVS